MAATWSRTHPLPNAADPVQPVQGTRPEPTPLEQHYRIDINTRAPVVREEDWRLRIGGLVGRPAEQHARIVSGGAPWAEAVRTPATASSNSTNDNGHLRR